MNDHEINSSPDKPDVGKFNKAELTDGVKDSCDSVNSSKGLIGYDFEDYLTRTIGSNGSFSIEGREFDGSVGDRWWEAKSGGYWNMISDWLNLSRIWVID